MNPKPPSSMPPPDGTAAEVPAAAQGSAEPGAIPAAGAAKREASGLSAEEQMARFEQELKENDWGHQPC